VNFLECQQELDRELQGNLENPDFLAGYKSWLNRARQTIVALNPDWPFLQTLGELAIETDTIRYDLAEDFVKINPEEVHLLTSRGRLVYLETKDFDYKVRTLDPGTPTHFRLPGYQKIEVFPPPDSDTVRGEGGIEYEYQKTFTTDLVFDEDEHGLPPHFEPILLELAAWRGWKFLRRNDLATEALNNAAMLLQAQAPHLEILKALNVAPPLVSDKAEQMGL